MLQPLGQQAGDRTSSVLLKAINQVRLRWSHWLPLRTKFGERMLVKTIVPFGTHFPSFVIGPQPDKPCFVEVLNAVRPHPQRKTAQQKEFNNSRHVQSIL